MILGLNENKNRVKFRVFIASYGDSSKSMVVSRKNKYFLSRYLKIYNERCTTLFRTSPEFRKMGTSVKEVIYSHDIDVDGVYSIWKEFISLM